MHSVAAAEQRVGAAQSPGLPKTLQSVAAAQKQLARSTQVPSPAEQRSRAEVSARQELQEQRDGAGERNLRQSARAPPSLLVPAR